MLALISRALGRAEPAASGKFSISGFFRALAPVLRRRSILDEGLEHLGTLPLTTQSSLALVRFHQETLLIGITTQNVTLIARASESPNGRADATDQTPAESAAMTRFNPGERLGTKENVSR